MQFLYEIASHAGSYDTLREGQPEQLIGQHWRLSAGDRLTRGPVLADAKFDMWLEFLLWGMVFYLGIGFLFSLVFVLVGLDRIDPAALGAGWGFRILILPGCSIFWPYLLRRWMRRSPPPQEFSEHRRPGGRS